MKKFFLFTVSALTCLAMVFATSPAMTARAEDSNIRNGMDATAGSDSKAKGNISVTIRTVINLMLFIVGIGAVVMIIYSGIRYVFSAGNSTQVTNAKNAMIYAIVGLVIAILAYAIINFVIDSVKS